jgi:riboflavin synthase
MFTGLIESLGTVAELAESSGGGRRLRVESDIAGALVDGESVAVNGVCLTVVGTRTGEVHFDVAPETLRVTTIGRLAEGAIVNLERSMKADARVGGHFVQGHVDATGTVEEVRQEGDSYRVTISLPAALLPVVVRKGSIAVDGVSLTVASIDDASSRFDVQIIPFTWRHTTFQALRRGVAVNVECDILGKYVVRALQLDARLAPRGRRGRT